MTIRRACLSLLAAAVLSAQSAPTEFKTPVLRPGEGFAFATGHGETQILGEARKEAPMGSLALLVWMQMEGTDWATQDFRFKCTGKMGPFTCSKPGGHGKVDLPKALAEDCSLAFLFLIAQSQTRWKADYGEDAAWARMEAVFAPFLGRRMPRTNALPPMGPAWVGDGDLLRTSPEAFLQWLMEPEQSGVLTFGRRFLSGTWVDFKNLMGKEDWWFKTATVAVAGEPAATSAWVVGGRGEALAVLHLSRGRGPQEGMVRMGEILGLKH